MKTISAKRLEAAGACEGQVQLFRDTFGDKPVQINAENWTKAGEVGLARFWLERLLEGPARAEYDRAIAPARAEYGRVRGVARAEYDRAITPAWAEYSRAITPAWAEFDRAITPARAEYDRAIDAAQVEYDLVRGAALFEALTKDS